MKIAIQGLGRMGMQIARKLAEDGHEVLALNRSADKVEQAVAFGAIATRDKAEVVAAFKDQTPIIWIMLPAAVVDDQVSEWLSLLPDDSVIIDGGNSDYRRTKQLNETVTNQRKRLVDIGVSGGVWGYQNGFSMMAGADDKQAFELLLPVVESLAKPEGAFGYFGPSGSGHFVKMVHNAIEYGMMESLAEGYRMLHDGPYSNIDLGLAGDVWQHHSVITSWLNELCRDSLKENPTLDGITGYVAENGEARWTLETANQLSIPMPAIQTALDVRMASQKGEVSFATQLLAAMRNKFGGHAPNKDD